VKCAVCHRKAKGFGWFNPRVRRSDPSRYNDRWVFCSRRCQEAFSTLMNKTEGLMIDPSDMEISAMQSCLGPLGEYVGSIGMQRPLADYTREEVLTLIDVVVTKYQDHMLEEHERMAAKDRAVLEQRLAVQAAGRQQGRV
jgi:hypothetical protein